MEFAKSVRKVIFGFTAMFALANSFATPIGYVDQVLLEGGVWRVKGWACEPGYGQAIGLDVYVGSTHVSSSPIPSTEWAEPDVHQACGTSPSLDIKYRYSIQLNASPAGQTITVAGVSPYGSVPLIDSGKFKLPLNSNHPATVLSSASKILLYIAHPDDDIIFAPLLGTYCAGKTCKIVVATKGGGPNAECRLVPSTPCGTFNSTTGWSNIDAVRTGEIQVAAGHVPAILEQGTLSAGAPAATVQAVISRWAAELNAMGGATFDSIVANEINTFGPNVILTFDPRHGSTCHPEHRAVGNAIRQAVINYSGSNFNKANFFIITTKRTVTSIGLGLTPVAPYNTIIAAPYSATSTVYSAKDIIPSKGKTGWAYTIEDMGYYPSQFTAADISALSNAEDLDRTTALALGIGTSYEEDSSAYNICP